MSFESPCWSSLAETKTYQIAEVRKVSYLTNYYDKAMNFESPGWSSLAGTKTYQIAEVRKVSE